MKRNAEDMTLKEVQYLIKQIEKGTLGKRKREKTNVFNRKLISID